MRYILVFALAVTAMAQSNVLPTLPVLNTLVASDAICTVEVQQDFAVYLQCRKASDGTITGTAVIEKPTTGSGAFVDEVICLVDAVEVSSQVRLECAVAGKIALNGYLPTVTKKRRWYMFWR